MLSTLDSPIKNVTDRAGQAVGSWCAVQTQSSCERRVADVLTAMGIQAFAPMECVRTIRRGRRETIERPVYPNYLFAAFNDEWERHAIRRTKHVFDLLHTRHEAEQHRLARDIESLQRVLEVDPVVDVSQWASQEGRRVWVTAGPFMGAEGEIIRRDRRVHGRQVTKDILCVGVLMLGRVVEVEIDPAYCEPL